MVLTAACSTCARFAGSPNWELAFELDSLPGSFSTSTNPHFSRFYKNPAPEKVGVGLGVFGVSFGDTDTESRYDCPRLATEDGISPASSPLPVTPAVTAPITQVSKVRFEYIDASTYRFNQFHSDF
jgi:hypothetical protein